MSAEGGPGTGQPVCPRHPDRVSYVRCQRCGRPACPECQRQAPVGVQCVDCVRQAAAAAPPVRTALGGRTRANAHAVTLTLIVVNVVVYLVWRVTGQLGPQLVFMPAIGEVQPYRFLSTAFLHSGFLHLALNMYALWIIGTVLEPVLGRWRYLALYLVSAVGGSVAVLLLASPDNQSWGQLTVGASGAVFGLFAAAFFVLRRFGRDATQILVLLVANFALGFLVPNISWQAHLGGMLTGAVLAAAYVYARRERRTAVSVIATVLVAAVLVALAAAKYAAV